MKIKIEIKTENAAMETAEGFREEITRSMERIGTDLGNGHKSGKTRDLNGNTIGVWTAVDAEIGRIVNKKV